MRAREGNERLLDVHPMTAALLVGLAAAFVGAALFNPNSFLFAAASSGWMIVGRVAAALSVFFGAAFVSEAVVELTRTARAVEHIQRPASVRRRPEGTVATHSA